MTHSPQWVIYGANGYTGELIARQAAAMGLRPILSGRNAAAVSALAQELGLEARPAALDDASALDRLLAGSAAVLHCAGPFVHTAQPMADACLRNGAHYLDITGEIVVFEALAARYAEAKGRGVMLLPGAGFDVVPSDCLAAHLNRRLPGATRLVLGIRALGSISRGTATTMLESIERGAGGMVRRDGVLTSVPVGAATREIDFGRGPRLAVQMPWGDVATAYHSTGIPNIEVYFALPPQQIQALRASRYLQWLLKAPGVMGLLKRQVRGGAAGPDADQRARGRSFLWGMAEDGAGRRAESRLTTPEGYALTVEAALHIMRKVLAGQAPPGYQTPSSAYGADLALEISGVERMDVV
jgi:short subunit dehydrogenase-like uncharacterized protein